MSLAGRIPARPHLFSPHGPYHRPESLSRIGIRHTRAPQVVRQSRLQTTYAGIPGQEVPRRSLFIRIVSTAAGASFFLMLGMYAGWELFPSKPSLTALVSKWPTDEETNSLYHASDADTARINEHVLQHPLAKALRSNADFVESRPHLKIPEVLRKSNLTGGTLAGPGRIAVPPVQFVEKGGKSLVSIVYLGEQLCGHPGIIHGGMLATLLDEGLARCCFPAMPNGIGVTANLKIDYRKPVKAEGYYVLRARTQTVEGRKAWVKGWIEKLDDDDVGAAETGSPGQGAGGQGAAKAEEAKEPVKLVEAEALFIEPKNAGVIKRLYTP